MIKTYIFDLDDTLVPYSAREKGAYDLLRSLGADLERMRQAGLALWPAVADGRLVIEEKWHQEALAAGVSIADAQRFVAAMSDFGPAYDDVLPVLDRLMAEGKQLAVITNGPPGEHQRAKMRRAGLDRFFSTMIFISSEVGAAKPDAMIFQHALQALGALPHEAAYVGVKAEHDAAAAAGVGMQGIWIDRLGSDQLTPSGVRRITTLSDL